MEKICKYFVFVIMLLNIVVSCVLATDVVDEIDKTTKNSEYKETKSENYEPSYISIKITNYAENISLKIDSLELCNVKYLNDSTNEVIKGNIILLRTNEECNIVSYGTQMKNAYVEIMAQELTSWKLDVMPWESKNVYAIIYGEIFSYLGNGEKFTLCNDKMYLTFSYKLRPWDYITVEALLYDGCPLYCINNGKIVKVIQSINFDVSINDWE